MKPVISSKFGLLLLSLIVGLSSASSAYAYDAKIDGLCYNFKSTTKKATVTFETSTTDNYKNLPSEVIVPETVVYQGTTYVVDSIGYRAFRNCKTIESIVLPGTIEAIGMSYMYEDYYSYGTPSGWNTVSPFDQCTNLKKLKVDDTTGNANSNEVVFGVYTYVEDYYYDYPSTYVAFKSCPLEEVYLGKNNKYRNTYYYDGDGTSVGLGYDAKPGYYSPKYWGLSPFYQQSSITKVTIGSKVDFLDYNLFYYCSDITDIVMMGAVPPEVATPKSGGYYGPFNWDVAYTKATLWVPKGSLAAYQAHSVWKGFANIKEADTAGGDTSGSETPGGSTSGDGVTLTLTIDEIKYSLDLDNHTATVTGSTFTTPRDVIIPDVVEFDGITYHVTEIGQEAFSGNEYVTGVTLGNNLEVIGVEAFLDCSNLTGSLTIPASVKTICTSAFGERMSGPRITNLIFAPASRLDRIEGSAFNSAMIDELIMPNSVTFCGRRAFENAPLSKLQLSRRLEDIGDGAFSAFRAEVLTIPNSVIDCEFIGEFENEYPLSRVTLGSNLTDTDGYTTFRPICEGDTLAIYYPSRVIDFDDDLSSLYFSIVLVPPALVNSYKAKYPNCEATFMPVPGWIESLSLVTPSEMTLKVGESLTINAICTPYNQSEAATINRKLIAISSDEDIVSSDFEDKQSPVVKAMAPGTADIVVETYNGKRQTIHVTVVDADGSSLKLSRGEATLAVGSRTTLTATTNPDILNDRVTWTTSDINVASVYKGTVIGRREGTATITATMPGGYTATCEVTVVKTAPDTGSDIIATTSPRQISIWKGETYQLNATVESDDIADKTLAWTSNHPEIATVDQTGKVSFISEGEATITAALKADASVYITWNISCHILEVDPTFTVRVGDNSDMRIYTDQGSSDFSFTSSNDKVATAEMPPLVTTCINIEGLSLGTATITIYVDGTARATVDVTVVPADCPTDIYLNKASADLKYGETLQINATVAPSNSTDKSVTWSSSDTNVATVDATGKVTAVGDGTAVIKVTSVASPSVSATCTVNVTGTPFTLSPEAVTLSAGATATVTISQQVTDPVVTSSDNSVAVASYDASTGLVTISGKAEGTATISVTAQGTTARCTVTVTGVKKPESITLNRTKAELRIGSTLQLTATLTPEGSYDPSVTWLSSNPVVAMVDDNGLVTPLRTGRVVITAVPLSDPTLEATCVIDVRPEALLGDANGDSRVLVNDALLISNYHVGKTVPEFCFDGADVDRDGEITIHDVTECIALVLSAPATQSRSAGLSDADGRLVTGTVAAAPGAVLTVPVRLEAPRAYAGLQADIVMPEGLTLRGVTLGERARGSHSLSMRRAADGSVRIVLFNAAGRSFADTDDALVCLSIAVDGTDATDAAIEMLSVVATDAAARCYDLAAEGGLVADPAGIADASGASDAVAVAAAPGVITVTNAEGLSIEIFSADGRCVARRVTTAASESFAVVSGIYIVRAGATARKILVR